ncbi:hypothetical protein [Dietzia maris]|uniref:hypothetical protein n=1 Tax=Dietzia maris TaxID=37915 RepID=UPI00232F626C|nr:hypothetical protein [Dietzia maris]
MSAQAFGNDQMRTYLAEALAVANSPLTVMPQDPQNAWDVRFHDARFDAHPSIRQDRLVVLLATRSSETVARALEYRSESTNSYRPWRSTPSKSNRTEFVAAPQVVSPSTETPPELG